MKVGYSRVSTREQNLDLQQDALMNAGCDKIYSEKISGVKSERPELGKAIEYCREGDTLVVWKLDRIGRSTKNLIEIVTTLSEKGVHLKSLNESLDTSTPGGKLIFHIFASLAEFERDIISDRTKAGLEAARQRGRSGGRPRSIDSDLLEKIKKMYAAGISISDLSEQLKVSKPTIYRYLSSSKVPSS